ncbi:hypothetical protein PIB30_064000 [Stylosanthes scabra]|uniref:Uncharacterized protein n=1 Tax=Stylosanthes scabra TaxID=79078 RepID=A0ABU6WLC4_9FABA|nr:hypothetical protein [Stylosanthes scabra]
MEMSSARIKKAWNKVTLPRSASLIEETIFGLVPSKMGSRVVFYEYDALKEYNDIDVEPTADGRFDPDRPYEFSITMLGGDCSFGTPRSTPSSNAMPARAPQTGPSPSSSHPLPTKDSVSLGLSLRTYPPHDWKAARTWFLPSLGFDFIASSEGWMCEGDETEVEETHGLDCVKFEGSKGKELVKEEEEDPEESLMSHSQWIRVPSRIFLSSTWETRSRFTHLLVVANSKLCQ